MDAGVDEIENRWFPLSMPWSVDVICVDEDTGEYKDKMRKEKVATWCIGPM